MKADLKEFVSTTGNLLGAEDQTAVESASVYLYNLFRYSPDWCRAHGDAIRKTFGPYPASVAIKACGIVKKINSYNQTGETSSKDTDSSTTTTRGSDLIEEFGSMVTGFQFNTNLLGVSSTPVAMATEDSLSEEEEVKSKSDVISHTLLSELSKSQGRQATNHITKQKKVKNVKVNKFGSQWLQDQCKGCDSEFPWQQLYQQLFELLLSEVDSTQLEIQVS